MKRALREYVSLVTRNWYTLVSAVAGCLGIATEMGANVPVPAWVWWVIAISALFIAQLKAFWIIYQDRESYIKSKPDMSLSDFLKHITNVHDLWHGNNAKAISKALTEQRQESLYGNLEVWARYDCTPGNEEATPLSPVPKELWKSYQIDYLSVMANDLGKMNGESKESRYEDFYFNRDQVRRIWPKKQEAGWCIIQRRIKNRLKKLSKQKTAAKG